MTKDELTLLAKYCADCVGHEKRVRGAIIGGFAAGLYADGLGIYAIWQIPKFGLTDQIIYTFCLTGFACLQVMLIVLVHDYFKFQIERHLTDRNLTLKIKDATL